jgi:hypothetical protein
MKRAKFTTRIAFGEKAVEVRVPGERVVTRLASRVVGASVHCVSCLQGVHPVGRPEFTNFFMFLYWLRSRHVERPPHARRGIGVAAGLPVCYFRGIR